MAETLDADGKVIGHTRGAKAFKRWVPKEWRPEYEAIVALSCTGLNNEEVGKRFGYGKQQVSNILNTPQAKKLRELIVNRLRDLNSITLGERMTALNEKALSRIEDTLNNDAIYERAPLAIFDRSFTFLKHAGVVKPELAPQHPMGGGNVIGTMVNITSEAVKQLSEGLRKSNEVKVLHDGNSID